MVKIGQSLFILFAPTILSMALYPPGDVPRQLIVVFLWLVTGFALARTWS